MTHAPILLWFRRDLRLHDNAALQAALQTGRPLIPIFIRDGLIENLGAAPSWRLGQGLDALSGRLGDVGGRLVLRSGPVMTVLKALIAETGATSVMWNRLHDPAARARDEVVKQSLKALGIEARSFSGQYLVDPWQIATGAGTPFRVFTPFWRALQQQEIPAPLSAPTRLPAPEVWPESEALEAWALGRAMQRGAAVLERHVRVGEAAALDRLSEFRHDGLAAYPDRRDIPGAPGTSRLSAALSLGEISPRQCWHAIMAEEAAGNSGASAFLRQLAWRDFAGHLLFHDGALPDRCWRPEWEDFPWNRSGDTPEVLAWKQGRTGVPFVDAAMREMQVTGTMHNRARMIAASYLTKHLLTDWRIGERWFAEHLVDFDAASNAMGWQWVAGCGPDASPYFRIFNPETQKQKFDPQGQYTTAWIAEMSPDPSPLALEVFEALPRSWNMSPEDAYPDPVVGLPEGRARALAAYESFRDRSGSDSAAG